MVDLDVEARLRAAARRVLVEIQREPAHDCFRRADGELGGEYMLRFCGRREQNRAFRRHFCAVRDERLQRAVGGADAECADSHAVFGRERDETELTRHEYI